MAIEPLESRPDSRIIELTQSSVRIATRALRRSLAERIHSFLPNLTPNQLTFLGTITTIAGAAWAYEDNVERGIIPSLVRTAKVLIPQGIDGEDGELATIYREQGLKHDSNLGATLDAVSDGTQEEAIALFRAAAANQRGDTKAEVSAYIAGLSSLVPRILRALEESQGILVHESSEGLLGFFGTRFGRAVLNSLATGFPDYRGIPIGMGIDLSMITSNGFTTIERLKQLTLKDSTKGLATNKVDEARGKVLPLLATAVGGLLLTYSTYRSLRK